jgi:hypothetical protein
MKKWLLFLCVVAVGFAFTAFVPASWVAVNLDERASVALPAEYKETPGVEPARMLSGRDAVGVYIAITSPLGADFQGPRRQKYYDEMIEEVVGQCNGKVLDRSSFSLGGFEGVDAAVSGIRPDTHQPFFVCLRGLLVGKRAYVLQFIPTDGGKNSVVQRKPFLTSLSLKPAPVPGK